MKFLGTLLLFGGYTLIYAAVAGHGRFATDPWSGLFADVYTESNIGQGLTSTGAATAPAPVRTRASNVTNSTAQAITTDLRNFDRSLLTGLGLIGGTGSTSNAGHGQVP